MDKDNGAGKVLAEFTSRPRFYALFLITSVAKTEGFYCDTLGCKLISRTQTEVELDFFGNRVRGILRVGKGTKQDDLVLERSERHASFGLLMSWEDWHRAVDHMNYIGVKFFSHPHVTTDDADKDYATFLLEDPSGNILEFKSEAR